MRKDPVQRYLGRHALHSPEDERLPRPAAGLKLCIVIPALAERRRLPAVLDSLPIGSRRLAEAEVIVLVNNSEAADAATRADNAGTLRDLAERPLGPLPVFGVDRSCAGRCLPAAQAGVGLARRHGMDLALRRLVEAGQVQRAAIACLDADSPVAPGYVDALLAVFDRSHAPLGGICAFAHPEPDDPGLSAAIVDYELWLRYQALGLRLCASPFAFVSIGSCTVVSATGYALADGMPPRQAAEDFHFLQKLAKVADSRGVIAIHTARVFPEARLSARVPFGTGRAMGRCVGEPNAYRTVEPASVFFDLKRWFDALPTGFTDAAHLQAMAVPPLCAFLDAERAWAVLDRLRTNHPSPMRFRRAVHHWFDGLRIVRYANLRAREAGRQPLLQALSQVTTALGLARIPQRVSDDSRREWLEWLRAG